MRPNEHATSESLDVPGPRHASDCPVEDWLTFLGHRWNAVVLWHLQEGPLRYGELVGRLPGITPKVLSERLEGLCRRGLVARSDIRAFPRGVVYQLTPAGAALIPILDGIETWSKRF